MKQPYSPPTIRELGSLQALTAQHFNKVGMSVDMYTTAQNDVVGSLVPIP